LSIKGETYTVNIDHLDERGSGQAVVWREHKKGNKRKYKLTIPYTLPGEKVRVNVKYRRKRRWISDVEEVLKQHHERIEPRCPHFARCGGCTWQHWHYEGQLQEKTKRVKEWLASQGFPTHVVQETIGMDEPWYYRNKMELTFREDGSLGFHEQGNFKKIVPIETCFIMSPKMRNAVLEIAQWAKDNDLPGYNKLTHEGLLRHVMVRQSFTTGELMLVIFATKAPEDVRAIDDLIQRVQKKHPQVKSFMWMENRDVADRTQAENIHVLLGRDFIYDELAGYKYRLWFDTFFQTNPVQAEKLVDIALEVARPQASETMIDLFCGVGTFSLPFANYVKQLTGIEIVEMSIESAKRNSKDNGLLNTFFLAKDARRGMDKVLRDFGSPDLLLLDPPRSGAGGKVMRRIGRSQVNRIIYVSCNPRSFAADIKELEPFGYTLKTVQPVDMFPQTFHTELVSLLEKDIPF